jgi:hypothetical protein
VGFLSYIRRLIYAIKEWTGATFRNRPHDRETAGYATAGTGTTTAINTKIKTDGTGTVN